MIENASDPDPRDVGSGLVIVAVCDLPNSVRQRRMYYVLTRLRLTFSCPRDCTMTLSTVGGNSQRLAGTTPQVTHR